VIDLAVVSQDPRFGGGARAQANAFVRGAAELGRQPMLLHPRFVPLVDSAAQLFQAPGIARRVRQARSAWVVVAAAPYGYGACRSGRPYAAWVGTSLEDEWASRRAGLSTPRRAALALNARLLRTLERRVLRAASPLLATSPHSRAALAAAAGIAPESIGILPIPVDIERFAPEAEDRWLARLARPTVVFVGRADDPRKNVGLLLEAWPAVRAAVPEARLRLIGRPPTGRPLPAGVESVGVVPSVADELRLASLFVLSSLQEGFGIVVAEALAGGVPVVVTPCGGPEELVRESGGGVVLESFAPQALAERVIALLTDGEQLLAARRTGRAFVETRHSPEAFRLRLAGIFEELGDA